MKKYVSPLIAVMALGIWVFSPPLLAALNDQGTMDLLVSGPWQISGVSPKGKAWGDVRVFSKDGTFKTIDKPEGRGHWRFDDGGGRIILTFADGHKDTISLPLDPKGTAGTDEFGKPTNAVLQNSTAGNSQPVPSPTPQSDGPAGIPAQTPPPISPEMQQKAADLVKTCHNDLVFVTGREGAGSGFIAAIGKSNFLITNAHVAAGINAASFKTLDDATVQPGAASVAVGRDIFCMAQPAGGVPLEIMQDVGSNAAIGDDVVVLGNAEGEGVINTITGRIVGIGGDRVEVDAPFVPGNSGSPIIHLKTGKVIGIATYLTINNYDAATSEKNAKPVVRRFGYRLDNVKGWQTVDWRSFYAQAAEMEKIETLTDDLYDFFRDLQENKGSVTPERHTNPVIKNRIDQWLEDKSGNHSAADQNEANANFLSFLKVACQSDVTAARQHMSYDYFQRELAGQQQARDEMTKAFEELIKNVRN